MLILKAGVVVEISGLIGLGHPGKCREERVQGFTGEELYVGEGEEEVSKSAIISNHLIK